MELRDSRRLTGPNLLWDRPGAVLDIALSAQEFSDSTRFEPVWLTWEKEVRNAFDMIGWSQERSTRRSFPAPDGSGSISLAISAPLDGLYAATELNEWALDAAIAQANGMEAPGREEALAKLKASIDTEANPRLIELRTKAHEKGLCFLSDDDHVSVGMGDGSMQWGVQELPELDRVAWPALHNIPHVLVTGTNGKSTTVRLLAAMAKAAGRIPGISSTDWIRVGDEILDSGDWSGPGGARKVLRDSRVNFALLETARGGMMRRGLALERSQLSVILNVAADHLGEWGAHTVEDLAVSKLIVGSVADRILLNADDDLLVRLADVHVDTSCQRSYFGLDTESETLKKHLDAKQHASYLSGDTMMLQSRNEEISVLPISEAPMTLGGAALYNVANALAAIAAADLLGLPLGAIREGLRNFGLQADDNPGRLNLFEWNGVQVLVDFAHNSHGIEALFATAASMPKKRCAVLLGQGGDRDDDAIRELTRLMWSFGPDLVVIKELTEHLRGRELGELPALIEQELRSIGAPETAFRHADGELKAARVALEWAEPGDLILLITHEFRDEILELVTRLRDGDWNPGTPLLD
jgi:UDP-N-acetylmuramyl tripeptide synthase